jgi:hypothetical protein
VFAACEDESRSSAVTAVDTSSFDNRAAGKAAIDIVLLFTLHIRSSLLNLISEKTPPPKEPPTEGSSTTTEETTRTTPSDDPFNARPSTTDDLEYDNNGNDDNDEPDLIKWIPA